MHFRKIWILLKPKIRKILENRDLLFLLIVGIIIVFLLKWDGQNVTIFKIPIYSCKEREQCLESVFHELFSWAWLIVAILYLLPQLLSPLSNSFLVNQMLWLRLAPCLPIEVAVSRVLWVISWAVWLGTLGVIWILFIIYSHQFLPKSLFLDVIGLISYVVFAGGIVIICLDIGFIINDFSRIVIPTFALFSPIIFYIFSSILSDKMISNFLPIALPFSKNMPNRELHISIAFFIGLFLLLIHIVQNLNVFKILEIRKKTKNDN